MMTTGFLSGGKHIVSLEVSKVHCIWAVYDTDLGFLVSLRWRYVPSAIRCSVDN